MLQKYDPNISGQQAEESVYNELAKMLHINNVKNTVVINGWKDKGHSKPNDPKRSENEYDFLIISEPLHSIIHIEVKRKVYFYSQPPVTPGGRKGLEIPQEKAAEQLANGFDLFQKKIPFSRSKDWQYVQVMYCEFAVNLDSSDKNEEPFVAKDYCERCRKFFLGPETDFSKWWFEISDEINRNQKSLRKDDEKTETYLNILKYLLHQMYRQEDCATAGQLVQETSKVSEELTFFWSKEQLKVLNSTSQTNKVVFTSGFGTGKTITLMTKVKELIGKNEEVMVIIFEGSNDKTILRTLYEDKFEELRKNEKIIGISGTKGSFSDHRFHSDIF